MGTHSIRTSSGITLLEVLVVMLMIAIFAVFVATRTMGTDPSLIAQTEVLKAHIRYAQMRSINTNTQWGIHSNGGTYWLFQNPNVAAPELMRWIRPPAAAPSNWYPVTRFTASGLQ